MIRHREAALSASFILAGKKYLWTTYWCGENPVLALNERAKWWGCYGRGCRVELEDMVRSLVRA
jgi:hypothetical protein